MPTATSACLIAATPRTGSWLLSEALASTDALGSPEEWFGPDQAPRWGRQLGVTWGGGSLGDYMGAVRTAGTSANGVFGAKLHWSHLQWLLRALRLLPSTPASDLDATVVASWFPGPCYVHLKRRDRARQAISMWRALATDVWWVHQGDPAPVDPFSIDLQEVRWLEDLIAEHEANWDLYFRRHSIVPLEIAYEDLAADRDGTVRRIAAFAGVDLAPDFILPPSRLRRQAGPETETWLAAYLDRRSGLTPKPSRSRRNARRS